jgi:hypothetical protein
VVRLRRRPPRPAAAPGGDVHREVGARLVPAHGARGDVIRAGSLLRRVEGAQPSTLLGQGVADLRREPTPRPPPHAAVPRAALGRRVAVDLARRRVRWARDAPVAAVEVRVVGCSIVHGWLDAEGAAGERHWSVEVVVFCVRGRVGVGGVKLLARMCGDRCGVGALLIEGSAMEEHGRCCDVSTPMLRSGPCMTTHAPLCLTSTVALHFLENTPGAFFIKRV